MQTLPPYAVPPVVFQFRALATLSGRLPLGGPREVALATLMAARFGRDALSPTDLLAASRRARATRARSWYAALALPANVRAVALRVVLASETGNVPDLRLALEELVALAGSNIDSASRAELKRLLLALGADA